MAGDFQLTGEIVLTGPRGLGVISKKLSKLELPANVSKSFNGLSNKIQAVNQATQTLDKSMNSLGKSFSTNTRSTQVAGRSLQKVRGNTIKAVSAMENFGRTVGFVTTRLIGFRIASGLVMGFGGAIRSAVGEAIDFERQLVKVAQVSDRSAASLSSLTDRITELSIKFGASSKDLIGVSKTLSQAGLTINEVKDSLDALAKSTLLPTFGDINQTAEAAIAVFKQFGVQSKDLGKVLAAIDSVTGQLAVEASDVTIAIQKFGGVFSQISPKTQAATDTFNQFLATFAAVRATTRESAQNISVGLRNIFTRIQRPDTIKFLKQFGIELRGVGKDAGKFVGPFEAIERIANRLGDLDARNLEIGPIVEKLGGARQVGKVLPLLFQMELRHKALKLAAKGQEEADEKVSKALETLGVRIGQVREEFVAFIRDVVQSDTFQTLANSILLVVQNTIKLAGALKPLLPALLVLGGLKALKFAPQFGAGVLSGALYNPRSASNVAGVAGTTTGGAGVSGTSIAAGFAGVQVSKQISKSVDKVTRKAAGSRNAPRRDRSGFFGPPIRSRDKSGFFTGTAPLPFVSSINDDSPQKRSLRQRSQSGLGRGARRVGKFASQNASGMAFGAAIASSIAAEVIGRKTQGRAVLGGAVAGAGQGAYIGSLLGGPAGAGIGALVGGLGGAVGALKDFKETLRQTRLDAGTERLAMAFEELERGTKTLSDVFKISTDKALEDVKGAIGALPDRRTVAQFDPSLTSFPGRSIRQHGTTQQDVQVLAKELKRISRLSEEQNLELVRRGIKTGTTADLIGKPEFLTLLGASIAPMEEVVKRAGNSTEKLTAILRDEYAPDVVDAQHKTVSLVKKLQLLNQRLDFSKDAMSRFSSQLRVIQDVANLRSVADQTILARAQGKTVLDPVLRLNVFKNLEAFKPSVILRELQKTGATGRAFEDVQLATVLPVILRQYANDFGNAKDMSAQIVVRDKLFESDIFKPGNEFIDVIRTKLEEVKQEDIGQVTRKLIDDFNKSIKPAVENMSRFAEGVNEANRRLREAQNVRIQLELGFVNQLAAIQGNAIALRNAGIVARGGQLTLPQQLGPTRARLEQIGVGLNPRDVINKRLQIQQQLTQLGPDDPARVRLTFQLGKTVQALQVMAGATQALTAIQQKIAEIEQRRIASQDFIQSTFLASTAQVREQRKEAQAFMNYQDRGGKFTPRAYRGGQQAEAELRRRGENVAADELKTFLTRQVPGGINIGNGIGLKGPGEAVPPVLDRAEQELQRSMIIASRALVAIHRQNAVQLGGRAGVTFDQTVEKQRQAMNDFNIRMDSFNKTSKELADALNGNPTITLNVPQPIPLHITGGGELRQEIKSDMERFFARFAEDFNLVRNDAGANNVEVQ